MSKCTNRLVLSVMFGQSSAMLQIERKQLTFLTDVIWLSMNNISWPIDRFCQLRILPPLRFGMLAVIGVCTLFLWLYSLDPFLGNNATICLLHGTKCAGEPCLPSLFFISPISTNSFLRARLITRSGINCNALMIIAGNGYFTLM